MKQRKLGPSTIFRRLCACGRTALDPDDVGAGSEVVGHDAAFQITRLFPWMGSWNASKCRLARVEYRGERSFPQVI